VQTLERFITHDEQPGAVDVLHVDLLRVVGQVQLVAPLCHLMRTRKQIDDGSVGLTRDHALPAPSNTRVVTVTRVVVNVLRRVARRGFKVAVARGRTRW